MSRPEGLFEVQPKNIATYTATCWMGDEEDQAIGWMASRFGWTVAGIRDHSRRGRCLVIVSRSKKRYLVAHGEYVIALGANGSLRVATPKEYEKDYKRVESND